MAEVPALAEDKLGEPDSFGLPTLFSKPIFLATTTDDPCVNGFREVSGITIRCLGVFVTSVDTL